MIDSKSIEDIVKDSIKQSVDHYFSAVIEDEAWNIEIEKRILKHVQHKFNERLSLVDFNELIKDHIDQGIDRWQARIRQNFATQGIVDRAESLQLTVLDDEVVVQNHLDCKDFTANADAEIKGTLKVNNLILRGSVNTDSTSWNELVQSLANEAINQMTESWRKLLVQEILTLAKTEGIEFDQVSIGGKPLVQNNELNAKITESNLEKLGVLKSLRVSGPASINDTLHVNNKRLGINTETPEMALGVWDEEVSMMIGKHSQNQAYLGTARMQSLNLGTNRQIAVTLDQEGLTTIKKLRVDRHRLSFESQVPGYSGTRGDLVINSDPRPGQPFAWQCLGAFKWQAIWTRE